ncbi:MAG: GNAT family N-acetyltransferase [Candidatus Eisenbacteria bacterium]|uniref:GNAT family N-acetyltransferase n=1 Tax=Eiseniibacteriota bacterium TaxID=2212470 RepID=A0A956LW97_UNCEI|nr:GNAT family N-acetyltransferase [Candidatus Eisenbacteria bacterium]
MFRSHPYRGGEDLSRLKAMVTAIWKEEGALAPFSVCDFDWKLYQHPNIDPSNRIRIWEIDTQPVGFAWYTPPGDVEIVIVPEHREMSLFQPMLEWVTERHLQESSEADQLGIWALESDVSLPFLLQRLGYFASDRSFLHLLCEMESAPKPPVLPEGYRIRHLRGLEELEPRAQVHRDAFAPARLTLESYRSLMQSSGYRKELDIVVEAPGGEFAAFALGWFDPDQRLGEIEPVGTHPQHRGSGLARAATTELLRRLHALGAQQVLLYTHSDRLVDRLYREAGFRAVNRSQRFVKS